MRLRFRISIYADIEVKDPQSIEDGRKIAQVIAENAIKKIENRITGIYNPYLGGVAFFPFGRIPAKEETDRL